MSTLSPTDVRCSLCAFTVTFRDGHTETVRAWTGVAAQFNSSAWSDVASVRPVAS